MLKLVVPNSVDHGDVKMLPTFPYLTLIASVVLVLVIRHRLLPQDGEYTSS